MAGPDRRDPHLVYVSSGGVTVYDLAAGEFPTDPTERVRLRMALIDSLRSITEADGRDCALTPQERDRLAGR